MLSDKLQVSPSDEFIVVVDLFTTQQLPSLSLSIAENSDSLFCNAIIQETYNKLSVERGMKQKGKDRGRGSKRENISPSPALLSSDRLLI